MQLETIQYDVTGDGVAMITLDRPASANAVDLQLAEEFSAVIQDVALRSGARAVLLQGAGKHFCGGGDVAAFAAAGDDLPALLESLTSVFHTALVQLSRLELPVVAAVQGSAAGGGLALAGACDVVVAGGSARFLMAYSQIGLSPDASNSFSLPRLVGLRRALDMALTNRVLSAQEALECGLVSRVVPDDRLATEAGVLAAGLATGPTRALGAAKRLLRDGWTQILEVQLQREANAIIGVGETRDAAEGITAFIEKRLPSFRGT